MGETVAKAKILVVENELPVTQFLSRVLTDEGHEVETIFCRRPAHYEDEGGKG